MEPTDTTQMNPMIIRAIEIGKYIQSKVAFHDSKKSRARVSKSYEFHRENYMLYLDFERRAFRLIMNLRSPRKLGNHNFAFLSLTAQQYRIREAERIAKGKEIFMNKHKYSPRFLQTGLHCDYGTYQCDRCNRTYYHSPSTITKGVERIYTCACGYCTNEIIEADWNEKPFF